ncbi:Nuclear pore complex protein Nup160 [Dissostichus eleginoides]|uniref:Nuclear pore complex protein Nup160 n=1 Tax=Dissostichus eleginoides TaxID=100907 RepID=A0AAD9B5J2_DISEL|nr:Nuclear pore complex protein Nup160 [Dissostichus eleginoides]
MEDIQNKLQDIRNPAAAMTVLLRELDLETDSESLISVSQETQGQPLGVRISLSQLYGSSSAVSIVCQAVCHMTMTRALFCRDMLILQKLYLRLGDNVFLGGGAQLLQLQQDLIPRSSNLLSSYHLLKHISQSMASSVALDIIEANLQHLTVLELSDSPSLSSASVLSPQTVVDHMISNVVVLLAQLLWPSNPGFQFPECLMANCQYTQLQEYVRLIGPWCQVNIGSCRFVLGQCYLANGEGQKALQCFQEAATEVEKEDFLLRLTGGEEEDARLQTTPPPYKVQQVLQYYNKVQQVLQYYNKVHRVLQYYHQVQQVHRVLQYYHQVLLPPGAAPPGGRGSAGARHPAVVSRHHRGRQRCPQPGGAVDQDLQASPGPGSQQRGVRGADANPDSSMQLDCLRQLVVVLCERSQLQDLVHFSYVNLHDEVVSIIESRARGLDLLAHNYYELLYAFHINRHNYRKGLQQQVNCFLSALNCLRLIRPEYAWIVQPAPGATYERAGASPKRNSDGEFSSQPVKRQVDILELRDLEREFILSSSRLSLSQLHPSQAAIAGGASAGEMVSLLVQSGLFDSALSVCQAFSLSLSPVFEGLTFKCIKLQGGGRSLRVTPGAGWQPISCQQSSTPRSQGVYQQYYKYPCSNGRHHRCVINKLLSHGVPLPDWLIKSYKEVDAASLLRLYLNFDLLEEAGDLVLEYVDALLGRNRYYGLEVRNRYYGLEGRNRYYGLEVRNRYYGLEGRNRYYGLEGRNRYYGLEGRNRYYGLEEPLLQTLNETQTNSSMYDKVRDRLEDYHRQVEQTTRRRLLAR